MAVFKAAPYKTGEGRSDTNPFPMKQMHGQLFRGDDGLLYEVTPSNGMPVAIELSDVTLTTGPEPATLPTDRSGAITLGGTAQNAMSAAARSEAWVWNNDAAEDLWINFQGGTASIGGAGCIKLASYQGWSGKVASAVSVIAATTAHKFTAGERA